MTLEIPQELFTTFNEARYFDEPHKYYLDGKPLISVTTILHKYQEEFDETYWAKIKADQHSLTPKEITRAWRFINVKGTMKGSIIHDYAENLFLSKVFPYPKQSILDEFGFDPILPEYEITKAHVDRFHQDTLGKLIPIRTEMIVYDKESNIGGMLDMLFYNVKMKEFQIWDYKTNKALTKTEPKRRLLNELMFLEDSDLEMYSLQLSTYKYIIEKNTGIKLGDSYLVWFSHNNENYEVIKCHDREYYVKNIFKSRIESLK